jgi:hypothetical protein
MKTPCIVSCALILAIISIGCATVGKEFNYSRRSDLVIGETMQADAEKLLGEPVKSSSVSNENGSFKVLQYAYAYADPTGAKARVLNVEFKNDFLNALIYNSGFPEDSTAFNIEAFSQISRTVSTKTDVKRIMGEPSGKALCPTSFVDFKSACENGTEVWAWVYTQKSQGLDTRTIKSRVCKVAFGVNETVSSIESNMDK